MERRLGSPLWQLRFPACGTVESRRSWSPWQAAQPGASAVEARALRAFASRLRTSWRPPTPSLWSRMPKGVLEVAIQSVRPPGGSVPIQRPV